MSLYEFLRTRRRLPAWRDVISSLASPLTPILLIHLAAFVIMAMTEWDAVNKAAFILSWGILNFVWIAVLRRPGVSAALSLAMVAVLVLLSQFKHEVLWQTANFVDLMVIDSDTVAFLFMIFPKLGAKVAVVALLCVPAVAAIWWFDPFRIRYRIALSGAVVCVSGLSGLAAMMPMEDYETFFYGNHVSNFARTGVHSVAAYMRDGFMDSAAASPDRLAPMADFTCQPAHKPPHIIMIHDESSFDIRALPGVKVPAGYGSHFSSFDGKLRQMGVEAAGGPSWYTEYNVFDGLSARSFGHFAYFVTRIAARHVKRGLPSALKQCGYRTFSIYPMLGAFMSARSFQTSAGVQQFVDSRDMKSRDLERDVFYYDNAMSIIEREHSKGPMFMFVYLAANHFPWDYRYRPELLPEWRGPGNSALVDEYLRRQQLSAIDYRELLERLKQKFPGESFLLVRFGDHQPDFAAGMVDPALNDAAVARHLQAYDPKYYTTYYALDTINYQPATVASARDTLEAPYIPLVVLEAAGLPLDPTFQEQKRILERCNGAFFMCAGGAEARRFNRLLIDAGLIKGL